MRFRTGLIIGAAAGYYLGARAGRERYEEIEEVLDRVRGTDAYRQTRERVLELVDGGVVGARSVLEDVVPGLREVGSDPPVREVVLEDEAWPDEWADTGP